MDKWGELLSDMPIQDKHPWNQKAQLYKKNTLKRMRAYSEFSLSVIRDITEDSVVSIKQDGEYNLVFYDKNGSTDIVRGKSGMAPTGLTAILANGNTFKWNFPALDEFKRVLEQSDYESAIFAGELVRHGPNGEILRAGAARAFTQDEKNTKYYVFDVLELDGQPVIGAYWERMTLVDEIFKNANHKLVEPVLWEKGDANVAQDVWNHRVLPEELEGVVIRTKTGLMKVKVTHDIDLGVVAAKEGGGKNSGMIGAVYGAFMDTDGNLRVANAIGSGFSDRERIEWWKWVQANRVGEGVIGGDKVIFVKPERVISIHYNEVTFPKYDAFKWDGNSYNRVPDKKVAKFQKPTLVKECGKCKSYIPLGDDKNCPKCNSGKDQWNVVIRTDKTFDEKDLRLDQVPGWIPEANFQKAKTTQVIADSIKDKNLRVRNALLEEFANMGKKNPSPAIQKFELEDGETVTYYPEELPNVPFSKNMLTCSCVDWMLNKSCEHTRNIEDSLR